MSRGDDRWVALRPDGSYLFGFPDYIRVQIVHLGDQLAEVLDEDSPDLNRLFPTAYPHDPERDAGYQILARDELNDHRRNALDIVRSTASATSLTDDELSAWMSVVNDIRLVLGTKLDVSEDDYHLETDDPADPTTMAFFLYQALGEVLGEIVDALTSALPEEGTERLPDGP